MSSGWLSPWAIWQAASKKWIIKTDDPLVPQWEFPNISGTVQLNTSIGVNYFVDPVNGLDTNDGKSWAKPFLTIAKALTVALDNACIFVGRGDINEEGLIITQDGLRLVGVSSTGITRASPLFIGTTETILIVRADDVEIAGFGFAQTFAAPAIHVADDTGAVDAWRCYIHDCYFDGWGTSTYLVQLGDTTQEAPAAIVENCKFTSMATAGIWNNSENTVIRGNNIRVEAATAGIIDNPNGGDRPDRWYLNNRFITIDPVAAIGISVVNTPTPGLAFIDGNHFIGFGASLSCDVEGSGKTGLMGLNYAGITALAIS
jgi:hypothetical protein